MAYNGTVDLISGIRQKNGGTFPLVNASAVYTGENERLSDAILKYNQAINDTRLSFNVFESLIKDGKYITKDADFESGSWGYSRKVENSKRLRISSLIPIKTGMVINYSNPTLDIYIGVLKSPTATDESAYSQATGWINAGSENVDYKINNDGWLVVIVRSHDDSYDISVTDYDCNITILSNSSIISEEIDDIKNIVRITQSIANGGIYTFNENDISQGQWSYGEKSKTMNYHTRLRTSTLIPVFQGMVINYTNPTLDIFFGVLDNPKSNSYLQSGWNSAGSSNAIYSINNDGWLTIVFRRNNEIIDPADYDCQISLKSIINTDISKASKQINEICQYIGFNGDLELHFENKSVVINDDQTYYRAIDNIRLSTDFMTLEPGLYNVTIKSGWVCFLYEVVDNVCYPNGSATNINSGYSFIFNVRRNRSYCFVIRKLDESRIYPADSSDAIKVKKIFEPKVDLHNRAVEIKWNKNIFSGIDRNSTSSTLVFSQMIPVPKNGFNIFVEHDSYEVYYVYFYTVNANGEYVFATNYASNYLNVDGYPIASRIGAFYPYRENVYFIVVTPESATNKIHICFGDDVANGGRLTNLCPITIESKKKPDDGSGINKYDMQPTFFVHASGQYASSQILRGSVVRLRDAKAIYCSAKYTMSAWIYDSDYGEDDYEKKNHLIDFVGGNFYAYSAVVGTTYIDLSKYGKDGFAVVVIHAPHTVSANGNVLNRNEQGCGGFRLHDDILDNVFVEYYNHVVIEHAKCSNPVFFDNLRTLKETTFPKLLRSRYRATYIQVYMQMIEEDNITLGFYAGNQDANVPLKDVSMKSISTALQNPCSNMYSGELRDWPNRTYNRHNLLRMFGGICSNLPHLMYGLEWFTRDNYYEYPDGWKGFKIIHDFDPVTMADQIQPGDWLYGGLPDLSDYHVVVVTDVISINGEIVGIESIEAYMPLWRYRFGWLNKPYTYLNLEFSKNEPLDTYFNLLVRPPKSLCRRMTDVWDMNTDYKVGTLMCNRGTDSVYCEGNKSVHITIADPTIETITVKKDGNVVETLTVASMEKKKLTDISELESIDIINVIRKHGSGYYTLTPNNKSEIQEKFYVPVTPIVSQQIVTRDSKSVVDITIPNVNKFVYATLYYMPESESEYDYDDLTEEDIIYNPDTDTWETVIIPFSGDGNVGINGQRARITHFVDEIHDISNNIGILTAPTTAKKGGHVYLYNYADIIYKTSYGTFVARCDNEHLWCSSDNNGEIEIYSLRNENA